MEQHFKLAFKGAIVGLVTTISGPLLMYSTFWTNGYSEPSAWLNYATQALVLGGVGLTALSAASFILLGIVHVIRSFPRKIEFKRKKSKK